MVSPRASAQARGVDLDDATPEQLRLRVQLEEAEIASLTQQLARSTAILDLAREPSCPGACQYAMRG